MIDEEDEKEHLEDEKLVQAKSKTMPSAQNSQPPRSRTRAARAERLEHMGYDTNEEVEDDYES